MRNTSFSKRVIALLLSLVMVIGLMPNITLPAIAVEQANLITSDKIADDDSFDNWKDYYGNNSLLPDGTRGISTWKAGGVWTDKSVYANNSKFPSSVDMDNPDNNFLVALSALASNKEIVGQSSSPTDTMLVLDLSNSMDQSSSVDDMVEAANETIDTLLKMNVNNRVGVVLYSGNTNANNPAYKSSATVILPLDQYTTTTTTTEIEEEQSVTKYQYLTVSGSSDTTVSVASGVRNGDNERPTGSKNTNGGTYIQNGLFQAWEEFEDMTDKGVVQSGTQAGIQRTPILVLMSDGAPTIATTNYYNVGTSNTGNGTSTTDRITFLTQLTAAWVKGKVSAHYNNTTAKLYTLGLGTANNANATAVLNPTSSNNTLSSYWTNYNSGTNDGDSVTIVQGNQGGGPGGGQQSLSLTYQAVAETVGKNYVDMYLSASNSAGLITAFQEIVAEIGLQSAYSATLVEKGEADLDGYITVEDELGPMMQVKDVKGILLGDTLFSGAELARSMDEGLLGQSSNPKEYGNVFVRTVKERIGIDDTSVAQQLIRSAYHSGQLSYDSTTGAYSNYIGWYGDADNNYLGFWQESYGYGMEGAPEGAKYINKSYGYLGGSSDTEDAADMMHVVVMVHTEIATGHQTVLFKIPSSLIPMVTYKVELDGESLAEGETATLTVTEADPIRLVYEVGLPDDVNNVNIAQKVAEFEAASGMKVHKDNAGNYVFYANSWDDNNDDVAPNISGLSDTEKLKITAYLPESHFVPNTVNERFYVQEDSVIYTRSGDTYTPVTSGINPNGTYYFIRYIVTDSNLDGKGTVDAQYEQLQPATVANANNFQQNADGYWEVKAGTIRQQLSNVILAKDENKTDTLPNTDQLWVNVTSSNPSDYNIYSFLGNNGKLTVAPATGIKVAKDVTELADGASATEEFAITVTINAEVSNPIVTDVDGNPLTDYTSTVNAGKTEVILNLSDGESAVISGLPSGVSYTVTEAAHNKYTAIYTGADTIVANTIVENLVTNTPTLPGGLYITKEVEHALGGEAFPKNYEFEFEVTFVDADGNAIANKTFALENNYQPTLTELTTDANGVMKGKLRHGETVYIKGIPAGATVTVEEVNIPKNYTSTTYESIDQSGDESDQDGVVTIVPDKNATVVVTNTYTPDKVGVDIGFTGTKNFDATEMNSDSEFTFKLQEYKNNQWADVEGKTVTVVKGENASKTFAFTPLDLEFDKPGVHSYQIVEVKGDNGDITYDRSVYTFSVNVVIDSNGDLQAEVVGHNVTVSGDSTNGYTVDTVFTNYYHKTATSIEIIKTVEDKADAGKTSAGFVIETYEATVDADGNWTLGQKIRETVTDAQGEALLVRNYDNSDFDGITGNTVTYHFIIKEKDTQLSGWTYDDTEYHVTVVLTRDTTTQKITADFDVIKVDAEGNETDLNVTGDTATIDFANTYSPNSAEVDLNVTPTVLKDLDGRDPKAGEFTFAIFKNGEAKFDANGMLTNIEDAIATGTNDANGNVTFAPAKLSFSQVGKYEYDVIEVKGSLGGVTYDATIYDLVVEVTDNGDGTLKADHYFEDSVSEQVTFKNTYTAEPTEVVIEGLKTLNVNSGVKILNAGDYTFYLYDEQGDKIGETTNLANGTFRFDAIEYTLADADKTFTYIVKEVAPDGTTDGSYSAGGVKWSGLSFTVTVEVLDDGDGTLSTVVTGNGVNTIKFVNTYNSNLASVTLNGTKKLDGRPLADGEYSFVLHESNADFTETGAVVKQNGADTVTNDDGAFVFKIENLGMGYHYYILSEVIPDQRATGIGYDASVYYITVQVTDSGDGQMSAITTVKHSGQPNVINPDIVFNNIYSPEPGELPLSGEKTYNGGKTLEDDVFSVGLYDASGDALQTAPIKADGSFVFENLEYTAADVGITYTYTIKEIIPNGATDNGNGTYTLGNNIYDGSVYTLTVTVTDNEQDGILEIASNLTKGGAAADKITFTNTFVPDPVTHVIKAKKTYEKGLDGGDFTFTLASADNKTNVNQSKTNDDQGDITFDAITFSTAGEYKFTVKEIDKILGFINYSVAEYEVTVTVVNENGVLRVSGENAVNTKNTDEAGLEFINVYVIDGEDEITLRGTKELTGDRTQVNANEFEFGLYDADGDLVESVKNDADGNFAFTTLKFDETDVPVNGSKQITYTVKEIAGDNARYTYDDTIYTVVVTVKDNDQGGVTASYTVNGASNGEITFTNTYTNPTPVTYTPLAQKNYNKPLNGGEFKFKLEGEIAGTPVSQEKTNAAGGTITFDMLSFPEAGAYTFTVKEIEKVLGFIQYSAAEYKLTVNIVDTKGVLSLGDVVTEKLSGADTENGLTFINKYIMDGEDEVTLRGTKTLTGDRTTVNNREFQFGLYDADNKLVERVWNDANGEFAFTTLEFDESHAEIDGQKQYTYTVKEIPGDNARYDYDKTVYTVVITVKDNDQGGITATEEITGGANDGNISFENKYTNPTPVTYTPMAKKNYNKTLNGGEFKFKLEGEIAGTPVSQEKTNAAGGTITFDTLSFPEAGTYTFTVKEIEKVLGFIEYSQAEYELVVTIVDTNGVLSLGSVTVDDDPDGTLEFTNTYVIDGEDEITLRGSKALTGGRTSVTAGEFEFGLYDADGDLVESVKNDADGNFAFTTLKFDETDVPVSGQKQITYTVKEIKGTDIRVTYDETVYTVVVTVKDNEEGGVTASYEVNSDAEGLIAFTNIYTPKPEDITVDFDVVKTVINKGSEKIGPEGFEFLLNALADGVADVTVKADANGKAKFTLTFTEDDIGNTYTYKITEINGGKANVAYSNAEYTITVAVSLNANNELVATLTKNGENATAVVAEFENVYDYTPSNPDNPETGDDSNIGMWIALMFVSAGALITLTVIDRKRRYVPKYLIK